MTDFAGLATKKKVTVFLAKTKKIKRTFLNKEDISYTEDTLFVGHSWEQHNF